jgi:hypothetical protein
MTTAKNIKNEVALPGLKPAIAAKFTESIAMIQTLQVGDAIRIPGRKSLVFVVEIGCVVYLSNSLTKVSDPLERGQLNVYAWTGEFLYRPTFSSPTKTIATIEIVPAA